MSEEDDEQYRNNTIGRFCEKEIFCHKVRDHCHLTGKYSVPAHKKGNKNVKQKQFSFISFAFLTSINNIIIYSSKSKLI